MLPPRPWCSSTSDIIGNGQTYLYGLYFRLNCFTFCIQLDEVESVEIMKLRFIKEVIILRKKYENI